MTYDATAVDSLADPDRYVAQMQIPRLPQCALRTRKMMTDNNGVSNLIGILHSNNLSGCRRHNYVSDFGGQVYAIVRPKMSGSTIHADAAAKR